MKRELYLCVFVWLMPVTSVATSVAGRDDLKCSYDILSLSGDINVLIVTVGSRSRLVETEHAIATFCALSARNSEA